MSCCASVKLKSNNDTTTIDETLPSISSRCKTFALTSSPHHVQLDVNNTENDHSYPQTEHLDHDNLVIISLIDFRNDNLITSMLGNNINFNQLKKKMSTPHKNPIPFSMKFEEICEITPPNPLKYPCDTKISHSHKCICVADELNKRIVFFNLETREFITSFKPNEYVNCLFIEENYDNQNNDAIYFGEYGQTVKYSIKDLLQQDNSNVMPLWKINQSHTYGMDIRIKGNQKQIFRFNDTYRRFEIMDPMNGKIIGHFQVEKVSRVINILFITPTKMIVSELGTHKCCIFEESSQNEWKLIHTITEVENVRLSQPLGTTIDEVGQRIFLSDFDNHRLITFDYDGNVLSTFKSPSEKELNPYGLCFDEKSGLLYVTDQQHNCVRVFK